VLGDFAVDDHDLGGRGLASHLTLVSEQNLLDARGLNAGEQPAKGGLAGCPVFALAAAHPEGFSLARGEPAGEGGQVTLAAGSSGQIGRRRDRQQRVKMTWGGQEGEERTT
jgi:hypothetical protein